MPPTEDSTVPTTPVNATAPDTEPKPKALGSANRPLRVAVIGTGPSAFYAVDALQRVEGLHARTDMFDRLPTPFGLVRGGVAPDHQKIKNVTRVYDKIATNDGFRFFGNVTVGRDLTVEDLNVHYDQVIWAVGNESFRTLGIPGEDATGVHPATVFVGWYNGHPDHRGTTFDLSTVKRVAVVGNGNVAMDVTRVLAKEPDALAETDIAGYALETLRKSTVEEVFILGRRGPAQAAFSPKEIKEIAELNDVHLAVPAEAKTLDDISAQWLESSAPKSMHRNVEFLQRQADVAPASPRCTVHAMFQVSPIEIRKNEAGNVCGVVLQKSELVADAEGVPRPQAIADATSVLDVDLVLCAIGYRGVPILGVPYDERRGVIPNLDGRVLAETDGSPLPGHYVVGWAKRGPTGLIGTNSPDSKATVEVMVEDLTDATATPVPENDTQVIPALLKKNGIDAVSWPDWVALDAYERAQGETRGKVRHKLHDIEATMALVSELRASRRDAP